MKNILLFLFFIITCSAKAQTSIYHPFPDSGAVWNVHYSRSDLPTCSAEDYFSYFYTGDTAIGGFSYKKVTRSFVVTTGDYLCNCCAPSTGYMGALRDDTSAHRIFFVRAGHSQESLLYDFNLTTGDTLPFDSICLCPTLFYTVITSVDSVLIGTQYRKSFETSFGNWIIEGIGSTFGLLEVGCADIADGFGWSLGCVSGNGITLYPDSSRQCEIINGINKAAILDPPLEITISPNPTTNKLHITTTETSIKQLKIFNAIGALQFEINNPKSEIDIHQLLPGIYFIQLQTEKGNVVRKFVKE